MRGSSRAHFTNTVRARPEVCKAIGSVCSRNCGKFGCIEDAVQIGVDKYGDTSKTNVTNVLDSVAVDIIELEASDNDQLKTTIEIAKVYFRNVAPAAGHNV